VGREFSTLVVERNANDGGVGEESAVPVVR
jgi:hypothetical protein